MGLSLLQRAVSIGPELVNTLRIIDGEGCKLVAKYSSLLRLAEGKLVTVMASNKDENHPPEVSGDSLGEEARNRNGCVGLDPEHNSSTGDKTVKPEKLLGEKVQQQIERVVLDAAHNVCVEENTTAESRGQDCGVLEAKVEGRVHLKIGGEEVEGNVEATLHGTIKLNLPHRVK